MSEYLQKIVYLTDSQYATLAGGGTVGSLTGLNDSYIYMTDGKVSLTDFDSSFVLPVSLGGTGASSWASGKILVGNGSNTFSTIDKATANTASTLVQRDASGNFAAGTITMTQGSIGSMTLSGTTIAALTTINTSGGHGLLAYKPSSWTGATSSQWAVGTVDVQGVIRSNNNDLLHSRNGTNTKILDAGNVSPSITVGAGTGSAAPTINVTVGGVSGTTAASITTASTSVYGVTKLSAAADNAALAATAKSVYDLNNTVSSTYLKLDGTNTMTGSINMTKAGECGLEVNNTQTTNPHKVAFIVGSSGNGGIYDRTKSKWIVYSDPSGNVTLNGNANTATTAENVTGTVAVEHGGTGTTTAPTKGGVIYASTTSAYASTAAGTSGQYLKSNGTNAPTWASFSPATIGLGSVKAFYGTCDTAAATTTKQVECLDFNPTTDLVAGTIVSVYFSTTNSGAVGSLQLSVGNATNGYSTAAAIKKIYNYVLTTLTNKAELYAGSVITFVYTGTYWQVVGLDYSTGNTDTLLRTYAGSADHEYPLLAQNSSADATSAWTEYTSSYKDYTGVIPASSTTRATINLSTGHITVPGGITANVTGNVTGSAGSVALSGVTDADDLKAIEGLTGTSGFLKKTAANTWKLDTTTYLTATHLYVNATSSGAASNAATANTTTYIHLYDDSTKRDTIQIKGSGATTVSATNGKVITISSSDISVTHTLGTTTKYYITGTTSATTSTGGDTFDTNIYATTTEGELSAIQYSLNISGTEKAHLVYNSTDDSIDFVFI